jgi:4-amino-4-deoxy-L-arabinose transferase-like glycosyltransferase
MYVLAIVIAAWLLSGPIAAAIAALIVGSSPFAHVSAGLILSDPLAALLTVAILITLLRRSRASSAIAGVLSGALVCVRLLGVIALPAVLVAIRGNTRRLIALACAAPLIAALATYQWHTFGSPFRTGYGYWLPGLHTFDFSFLTHRTTLIEGPFVIPDKLNGDLFSGLCPCPIGGSMTALRNIAFYPSVAAGLFWVFAPPLTGAIGLVQMIRDRATPAARYALVTLVLNLAIVLFYFDQAARFIAPAASLLIVYSAAGVDKCLAWIARAAPTIVRRTLSAGVGPT